MATKKNLSSDILQRILDSGSSKVSIDDDSIWQAMMSGGPELFKKRSVRLIGLAMVAVFTVAFVVYSAVFYVQNVLLYKADLQINQFGTFVRKSYNSEYAMFLYDPAEAWAASGLQVQKGDRLFISSSGAYHTKYECLIDATRRNHWADARNQLLVDKGRDALNTPAIVDSLKKNLCRYIDMSIPPDSVDPKHPLYIDRKNLKVKQPLHLGDTALFGDVLMQIVPEEFLRDTGHLTASQVYGIPRMQSNVKEPLIIDHNGVLAFGVNDSRPQNNVGQILVVMEIYRQQTWQKALRKLFQGQLIDLPYFWYDYWRHHSVKLNAWWHPLASIAFALWVILEYLLACIILYCIPFLIYALIEKKSLFGLMALVAMISCHRPSTVETNIRMWENSGLATEEELATLNCWRQDSAMTDVLNDAFGSVIEFGTAGLRGPMGPGTNRLNAFSVARATQGLANYLNEQTLPDKKGVVIGYDSRKNSQAFALITADVLTANGIPVFLFDSMRPTPEISFAIRELNCMAGVNITASHNPKEDNGYKAYWHDGGQIVPPHDKAIMDKVQAIRPKDIRRNRVDSLVTYLGEEMDLRYAATTQLALLDKEADAAAKNLKIVYSPMHGAGNDIVPLCLKTMGITAVSRVMNQLPDNGEFASVQHNAKRQANPEDPKAMQYLLEQAQAEQADLAVATDPDADRFGFYCKDSKGTWQRVDGHQSTMLFTQYIIDTRKRMDSMPEHPFMGRTIVTSEIVRKIAQEAGITMYDEYTGFKWIAHRIETVSNEHPEYTFIGGGEESFCYLPYAFSRDKDAPASICLLAEMYASARMRGTTLWDDLMAIYKRYGFQREYTESVQFVQNTSWSKMKGNVMSAFRNDLKTIGGEECASIDYSDPTVAADHNMFDTSDVLQYFTKSGIKVTIRPSGTEPKLKFYVEVPCDTFRSADDYAQACRYTASVKDRIVAELAQILQDNHFEMK